MAIMGMTARRHRADPDDPDMTVVSHAPGPLGERLLDGSLG